MRALESGADAVVADLEDAVAPAEKLGARDLATRLMAEAGPGPVRLVRVNGAGTEWHEADLAAVAGSGVDGVVVPKATTAAVRTVGDRLGGRQVPLGDDHGDHALAGDAAVLHHAADHERGESGAGQGDGQEAGRAEPRDLGTVRAHRWSLL